MDEKLFRSSLETLKHINRVRQLMRVVVMDLNERAKVHDQSKLESPELEIFGEWTPRLAEVEYGSAGYFEMLDYVRPAIVHHYSKNRHHPEYHPDGINDMTLLDLVEMFVDWRAAAERTKNGDLRKSIAHNAERYGMSEQLTRIFNNTVSELFD